MFDTETDATTRASTTAAGTDVAGADRELPRAFGAAYLGDGEGPHLENNWVTGMWFMGNSYQKRDAYYGAFQGNFLKRIAALFPDRRRTLHLFAGRVDLTAFPGDTLDCNPALAPTYCCNAETCDGVPLPPIRLRVGGPALQRRATLSVTGSAW